MHRLTLLLLAAVVLGGCAQGKRTPEELSQQLGSSIQQVRSVHFDLSVDRSAALAKLPLQDASLVLDGWMDVRQADNQRFDSSVTLEGTRTNVPIVLTAEILGSKEGAFARLANVTASHLPFTIDSTKWYRIAAVPSETSGKKVGTAKWPQWNEVQHLELSRLVSEIDFIRPASSGKNDRISTTKTVSYQAKVEEKEFKSWLESLNEVADIRLDAAGIARVAANSNILIWHDVRTGRPVKAIVDGPTLRFSIVLSEWNKSFQLPPLTSSVEEIDLSKVAPLIFQ